MSLRCSTADYRAPTGRLGLNDVPEQREVMQACEECIDPVGVPFDGDRARLDQIGKLLTGGDQVFEY